jgi:transcriptional regulator with XRE-family HTH domain
MAAEHVERIGARIRQRREELGLSRDAVARQMSGTTNGNAVYRWEKGKHEPRPEALEDLARVLDVSVAYFYVDQPDKSAGTPDLMRQFETNDAPPWAREILEKLEDIALEVAYVKLHVDVLAARVQVEQPRRTRAPQTKPAKKKAA